MGRDGDSGIELRSIPRGMYLHSIGHRYGTTQLFSVLVHRAYFSRIQCKRNLVKTAVEMVWG